MQQWLNIFLTIEPFTLEFIKSSDCLYSNDIFKFLTAIEFASFITLINLHMKYCTKF